MRVVCSLLKSLYLSLGHFLDPLRLFNLKIRDLQNENEKEKKNMRNSLITVVVVVLISSASGGHFEQF